MFKENFLKMNVSLASKPWNFESQFYILCCCFYCNNLTINLRVYNIVLVFDGNVFSQQDVPNINIDMLKA
jgi:hypothetical protein